MARIIRPRIKILFFALSVTALFSTASGQTLLTDDFSSATLDSGVWQTILPRGDSEISINGGYLTSLNRGILATVAGFSAPYAVSGDFIMQSGEEHFNIVLRTDLSSEGDYSYFEREGMLISFANEGSNVSIQRFTTATNWEQLAVADFSFNTGRTYSFSITDNGNLISVSIDGSLVVSASSTYYTGSQIAFYSREFGSTSIDGVTISAIPEPATYSTLIGFGCLLIGLFRFGRNRI